MSLLWRRKNAGVGEVIVLNAAEIYTTSSAFLSAVAIFDANASNQWGTECVPNTSTDRITVQSDGLYEITMTGVFIRDTSSIQTPRLYLHINGAVYSTSPQAHSLMQVLRGSTTWGVDATRDIMTSSKIIDLSANDYIQIQVSASSTIRCEADLVTLTVKKLEDMA